MSMTESERLTYYSMRGSENDGWYLKPGVAWEDARERLAMYEDIGTVSEFRELKEKATAKRKCPNCNELLSDEYRFCPTCSRKVDWSEGKE